MPPVVKSTATIGQPSSYRPEIDGLRAVAVIAVIINHINKGWLPSGFLGVDIFFVISGFVITASLQNRTSTGFADFISGFYVRRIKRLVPALVLCILITSLVISLFDPNPWGSFLTGITALFGFSNVYLYRYSTDYFAASTELNVFTHTWSLGVEEQFYFLFPFLVWLSGFSRQKTKGPRHLGLLITILGTISLASFIHLNGVNQPAAYFLMPARFWELGAGCLLFLVMRKPFIRAKAERIPPLAIFALLLSTFFLPLQWIVQATIATVVLTGLLIASLRPSTSLHAWLSTPRIVSIGLISYSLYLWHWSVLSISRWTIGIHWWSIPFQILLIVLLSVGSYRYVEKPLRHANWGSFRWQSIGIALGSVFVSAVVVWGLAKGMAKALYLGSDDVVDQRVANFLRKHDTVLTSKTSYTGRQLVDCESSAPPFSHDALKGSLTITQEFLNQCLWSNSETAPLLAFLGDSHTGALFPLSEEFAKQYGFAVFHHMRPRCIFPSPGETSPGCREVMLNNLETLKPEFAKRQGSIAVSASYLHGYLDYNNRFRTVFRDHPGGTPEEVDKNLANYLREIPKVAASLLKTNTPLVLMAPLPIHPYYMEDGNVCTTQWFQLTSKDGCHGTKDGTNKDYLMALRKPIVDGLRAVEKVTPNLYIYDPMDDLCPDEQTCPVFLNGKPLFKDDDHLSTYGAQYLYEGFKRYLISKGLISPVEKEQP